MPLNIALQSTLLLSMNQALALRVDAARIFQTLFCGLHATVDR